jgi:hypothetical protein
LVGSLVAAFLVELAYVAFVSLGLPSLIREGAGSAGFRFRHGRMLGFVPGRVHVDGLQFESSSGPRLSLRWKTADFRVSLLGLLRGDLHLTWFSGAALCIRLPANASASRFALEPDGASSKVPAFVAARASLPLVPAAAALHVEHFESSVERVVIDRYGIQGAMTLRGDGLQLGGGTVRAKRLELYVDSAGLLREAVIVARQVTGRVSIAVTVPEGVGSGDGEHRQMAGEVRLRAAHLSPQPFPLLQGLSLGTGATAFVQLEIRPAGVTGMARLTSPQGLRWTPSGARRLSSEGAVTLTAARRTASEPVRLELSVPVIRFECHRPTLCVEAVEHLFMATETRLGGPWNHKTHDIEVRCGPARLKAAGRAFEVHTATGSVELVAGTDGESLRIARGALEFRAIDWRAPSGSRPLAFGARLDIHDGFVSRGAARIHGSIHAHGSDAGTVFALAPLPWLEPMLAGVVGKPYSLDGRIGLEPGRFELEDAHFSAAPLAVRGILRWHDTGRSGVLLFKYGSWSVGAVVREGGLSTRFGVNERWLERRSGTPH